MTFKPVHINRPFRRWIGLALVATDTGEAGLQHAAVEELGHDLVNDCTPAAILALEPVLVATVEAVEMVDEQPVCLSACAASPAQTMDSRARRNARFRNVPLPWRLSCRCRFDATPT